MTSPVNPGQVVWSGDNPGIYLKDAQDRWQALAVYFRVVVSPHGAGRGMLVLGEPFSDRGWPLAPNLFMSDNEPLMRWLVADFVSRFASFRGAAGLQAMRYVQAEAMQTTGDGKTFHQERMKAGDVSLTMRWEDLAKPFAVDVPPAISATGQHQMYSVFVEAKRGVIMVNDQPLPGQVIIRDFLGGRMSTSFLAFSETWVKPA